MVRNVKLSNAEKVRRRNRARIHCRRRFSVEHLGEDQLKYTCRTCGWSKAQRPGGEKAVYDPRDPYSSEIVKKLAAYQDQGGGASGTCPACTQKERDRQYPRGWGPLGPQKREV